MRRTSLALFLGTLLVSVPAAAADKNPTLRGTPVVATAVGATADDAPAPRPPARIDASQTRPGALPSLYVSLAGLQAYAAYSTLTALKGGAIEANPMVRGVTGSPATFIVVKGAATMASIFAAERLWRTTSRRGDLEATNELRHLA